MKTKDLKINFRYLGGNIACLSVDSIDGEPVHNDINDEEAIIIFNSLVGEKENCQNVKTLLKENQKLKKYYEYEVANYESVMNENYDLKKQLEETDRKLFFIKNELDMREKSIDDKLTQQKEFIKYLEDELKQLNPNDLTISKLNLKLDDIKFIQYLVYKEILQKYKEIIGDDR